MIRSDKIQTSLFGGVGFKNSDLAGYDIVDDDNQDSLSGLYFQDGSELVSVKYIKDSQENESITDEQFNVLLTNMQNSVILDVCNKVIDGQSDFITSLNLYPFEKAFDNVQEHKGKFVGFEIQPLSGSIICKIPYVELSFNEEATFDLYLYNSNLSKSPILTKSVTTTAGESKAVSLDWVVADDLTYKGGKFYLGYFDADLGTAKAYKKDFNSANVAVRTPYFYVSPVNLSHDGTTINVRTRTYDSDIHGLNIGLDVYNDYTELIVRNKSLFWNSIQLQMHEKVLMMIKYSTRSNLVERIGRDNVKFVDLELYGNKEHGIVGIQHKLANSVSTLRKSLFHIPRVSKGTLR
jgi:hypothetical protein